MSYQVTARKWRPMVFEDVVGQSHVTGTLRNAIATNRLAHAYIFSGARGCGKTTTARILAKAINCLSPQEINPDNACEVCQEITAGRSLDVIEIDGASNRGVEEIRNLRESVRYTPTRGKYKVYIIDEVHMLTKEAFNALLKTLEEPPEHVIFIFATTEVHKIPMTILSRCQRFDFRRISIDEITGRLRFIAQEEQVKIDDEALMIIAKKGDGSLRDAQSIFDQIRSFCGNEIAATDVLKVLNVVDQEMFFRVTDLIKEANLRGGIDLVDELMRNGYDLREFLGGLSEHLRNLLIVLTTESTQLIETSEPYRKRYQEESTHFHPNDILRLIKLVNDLEQSIRWAPQPRFKLEAGLLQMIKLERSVQIDALLRQIDDMKKKLSDDTLPEEKRKHVVLRDGGNGSGEYRAHQSESPHERPPTEIKVVGKVSAGPLRSAAAYSTSTAYEASLRSSNVVFGVDALSMIARDPTKSLETQSARTPEQSSPSESLTPISIEQAYNFWQQWIGEVRKSKIGVGTILSESRIIDVIDGALRIACPDDYHLSSLKRNKEFLVESFEKLSGRKVRLEPILQRSFKTNQPQTVGTIAATPESLEAAVPPSTIKPTNGSHNEHPVLTALLRELGAELLEPEE